MRVYTTIIRLMPIFSGDSVIHISNIRAIFFAPVYIIMMTVSGQFKAIKTINDLELLFFWSHVKRSL